MKNKLNFIGTVLAIGLCSSMVLTGCEDTDYPEAQPSTSASAIQSRFLFVNAAPGAPALNFFVENNPTGQNIAFGQATPYTAAPVGPVQLRAKAASGNIGGVIGTSDILFRAGATNQNNFAAAANTSYTVFVTDSLNRPRPTTLNATNLGGPQLVVVTDPLTQTLAANAGGVRFFHLAPDAPVVSVRLSVPTSATGVPPTVASFLGRAFRNTAVATFTSVPAGTYRVDVFAATTIPTVATTAPVLSTTVTVEATKLYTVFAQGLLRNRTLGVGRVQHN